MREPDNLLTAFLHANHAACPRCRYDLKGVTTGACPECGLHLALIVSAPPSQRALKLLCFVVVCCGLLLNTADTLRYGTYAISGQTSWFGPIDWTLLYGCAALATVSLIMVMVIGATARKIWSRARITWTTALSSTPVVFQSIGYLIIVIDELS